MDIKKTKIKDPTAAKGIYGSPKKGGGGGKGTWGKGGADDLISTPTDSKDPNYDSDEEREEGVIIKKIELESPINAILKEYFIDADIEEASRKMKELNPSSTDFVQKAIISSMEKQPYERELTSKLLSALYPNILTPRHISDGFQFALDNLKDTKLDIPLAADMLGKFIARAILDEIIPPVFVKNAWPESDEAKEALALANGLMTDNHRSKKLEHIWGPGDLDSVKRLKKEASFLVTEFINNGDLHEADRCIRDLNAPSFHFQIIRQALVMALGATEDDRKKILELLAFFSKTGLVVPDHMTQGFQVCFKLLDDTKLDIPKAPAIFSDIVQKAQHDGWLSREFKI